MPSTSDRILSLLDREPRLSQKVIAERLDISVRTARRHLAAFVEAGLVQREQNGTAHCYLLGAAAKPITPLPHLTEYELEALAVAILAARPLLEPTPLADALDAVEKKLLYTARRDLLSFDLAREATHWSFDGSAGQVSASDDPTVFRVLLDAARDETCVRADYYTANRRDLRTNRTLAPLGLMVRNGGWIAVCGDTDAEGTPIKDFALAGFRAVTQLEEVSFERPRGFSLRDYVHDRFGAVSGEAAVVRMRVEDKAMPYFFRKAYAPTQQIESVEPDGSGIVSFDVEGLDAVRAWAMSWGPLLQILEPESLAESVASGHAEAAESYRRKHTESQHTSTTKP